MRNFSKVAAVVFAAVAVLLLSTVTFARGWVQVNGQWFYQDGSGEYVTNTIKTSGTTKYYLGEDGAMVTNMFVEDYNDYSYYFGANGAMVTNTWVAVDPAILSTSDDDAPSAYWFYFGTNGKAYKANGSSALVKKTIDGNKYAFDDAGHMLTGWISEDTGKISEDEDDPFVEATYYAGGENDGVLRKGWHSYVDGVTDTYGKDYGEGYGDGTEGSGWDPTDADVVWFYFQTSNCKKFVSNTDGALRTKKINGKTYAFTKEGMMFEGWQFALGTFSTGMQYKYYSGKNGGNLTKKGWIFEVPTTQQNAQDQDDSEERWFYADGSGKTVIAQTKKINNKYYIFDKMGIMKRGLLLTTSGNKYLAKVKLDETDGKRFIAHDAFVIDSVSDAAGKAIETMDFDGSTYYYMYDNDWTGVAGASNRLFYFKDDDSTGDRATGTITLEFADNDYTFVSNNSGGYMGGKNNNTRFYANGIALKANPDVKYGIVLRTTRDSIVTNYAKGASAGNGQDRVTLAQALGSIVVSSSGAKIKKNAIKKDGNDNYWVIDGGRFLGVYNVQMKRSGSYYQFKSDFNKPKVSAKVTDLPTDDTTNGYGWCFHYNYNAFGGGTEHSDPAKGLPYTAANVTNIGGNTYWSYDVNGKTAVYPMITRAAFDDAHVGLAGVGGVIPQQDFNATLDDDMAVDFYFDPAEK